MQTVYLMTKKQENAHLCFGKRQLKSEETVYYKFMRVFMMATQVQFQFHSPLSFTTSF